jgi:hypothetical protein
MRLGRGGRLQNARTLGKFKTLAENAGNRDCKRNIHGPIVSNWTSPLCAWNERDRRTPPRGMSC